MTTDTKNPQQNIALIFFIYWLIDFLTEGKKTKQLEIHNISLLAGQY